MFSGVSLRWLQATGFPTRIQGVGLPSLEAAVPPPTGVLHSESVSEQEIWRMVITTAHVLQDRI